MDAGGLSAAVVNMDNQLAHLQFELDINSVLNFMGYADPQKARPKIRDLALEEMQRAWQFLIDSGHFTSGDAQPFLDEIARMLRNLHRVVPRARQFVRPGLDELDAVRKLDAADRGH